MRFPTRRFLTAVELSNQLVKLIFQPESIRRDFFRNLMNCMIHYIWLRKTKNKSNHRRTICNDQWRHMRSSKWLIKVNVIDLNYVIVTWCKKWVMMTQHESIWVIMSTCVPCVMLSASYRAPCWVTMSHDGLPWVMMSYFASGWLMVTHGDSLGFMVIHDNSWWLIMTHVE